MSAKPVIEPVRTLRHAGSVNLGADASTFTLENDGDGSTAEVVLDYQHCEGGLPVFFIGSAAGPECIDLTVVYSEGIEGIDHATGMHVEHTSYRYADSKQAMARSFSSQTPWTLIATRP